MSDHKRDAAPEGVPPGTCVWRMRNGRGCGRDAIRFLRVVPGERRWFLCGIHARAVLAANDTDAS